MSGRGQDDGVPQDGAPRVNGVPASNGAVRPVSVPPGTPAVPPSLLSFGEEWRWRWACRRLDRLARELHRGGWSTRRRYGHVPPVLHVFAADSPSVGDSVTVVRGPVLWWFRSSAGAWLGPCWEPWRAAESVTALLGMWGITPGRGRRRC